MKPDIIKVLLVHVSAVGLTMTHVEAGLKIIGLVVSAGYISWKWYTEYKEKKQMRKFKEDKPTIKNNCR